MNKALVAVIDNNREFLQAITSAFRDEFEFVVFSSPTEFVRRYDAGFSPDVILTDYQMPEMNGLELTRIVRECDHDLPILLISGWIDKDVAIAALELGVMALVEKPVSPEKFEAHLRLARSKRFTDQILQEKVRRYEALADVLTRLAGRYEERSLAAENSLWRHAPKEIPGNGDPVEFLRRAGELNELFDQAEKLRQEISALRERRREFSHATNQAYLERGGEPVRVRVAP